MRERSLKPLLGPGRQLLRGAGLFTKMPKDKSVSTPISEHLPRRWGQDLKPKPRSTLSALFGCGRIPHSVKVVTLGAIAPMLVAVDAEATHTVAPDPSSRGSDSLVPAAPWTASEQPKLKRRASGPAVERLQNRLLELGYHVGEPDGAFGPKVLYGVVRYQIDHDLPVTGIVDTAMWTKLAAEQPRAPSAPTHTPGGVPILERYTPHAAVTKDLFREAAVVAGVPASWADSNSLHRLLAAESDGWVGRPNYSYGSRSTHHSMWTGVHAELMTGKRTTRSSASGLGQLLIANVRAYYPSGQLGIGDPLEEAVGMLRYIKDSYGTPTAAWNAYNSAFEGY